MLYTFISDDDLKAIALNTPFGQRLLRLQAEQKTEKWDYFVDKARTEHHKDGECELDDYPCVSFSDDGGAYVSAWVWVYDETEEIATDESRAWGPRGRPKGSEYDV